MSLLHIDNLYGTISVMDRQKIREKAVKLREQGKTYSEIQKDLKVIIPKSTLSNWCSKIELPREYQDKIRKIILNNARKGRKVALVVNRRKRKEYLKSVANRNKHLAKALKNKDIAKITLVALYLGEGGKNQRGSLLFGNSDPFIISLFLYLLRYCYDIDESKFRCTLMCRADQNIKKLERFWSQVTRIPYSQFYKASVDPRTAGKPTRNKDYRGVCKIDYFSSDIYTELMMIPGIVYRGK
jgi:hypothetical protein